MALSLSPDAYKAGLTEDAQVLRHGAKADVEALGDGAGGELLVPDQAKDFAAPRLGDWLRRCLERPAARDARAVRAEADAQVPVEVTRAIARNNRL